ncbi:hypothetical protein [Chromobacterium haemolyticum]|uniref:hypothetical protein n=1 Tax=Chromobacterium haemolyticum TaxID=394935 RepID=UPI00244B636E|nr:hypothetical protein [Chromobacterium haemolyticum]MDH0342161.1 hypothetical protein [Chromobacterium haemolyticum]
MITRPKSSSVFLDRNFMGPAIEVHGQVVLFGSSARLYNQAIGSGWDAEAMAERSRLVEGLWRLRGLLQVASAGRGWKTLAGADNDDHRQHTAVLMPTRYGMSAGLEKSEAAPLIQAIDNAVLPESNTAELHELFENAANYLDIFTADEISEGLKSARQAIRLQRDVVAQYEIPDGDGRKILGTLSLDDYMPEDGDTSRLDGFAAAIAEYEREYGEGQPGELLSDSPVIQHRVNEAIVAAREQLDCRPTMS